MPDALLDRIRTEIEARLDETRAARDEYARLERALAALDAADGSPEPASASKRRPRPHPDGATVATPRRRAPRGQNRKRVLAAVGERPGASAAELSRTSGVGRPVLYTVLTRLIALGEIEKETLPGGRTGYVLAGPARA